MRINDNPQRIQENIWDKYVAEKTKGYILHPRELKSLTYLSSKEEYILLEQRT
jgi:hypothetical protein